jgi:hypothetical protein
MNTTLTTYTSPLGNCYEVQYTNRSGFNEWNIFHNGAWVQFALSEEGVANSVAHYENPGRDLGSAYD